MRKRAFCLQEMKGETATDGKLQWHPAFYGGLQIDLAEYRDILEFRSEYNLSKLPLKIDVFIVKKDTAAEIKNPIGRIFRKYNIIEYKSPGDTVNIDDYAKTVAYALLYKSTGDRVNERLFGEMTVSFFYEHYPAKLVKELKSIGVTEEKVFPGIYYLSGFIDIPVQLVITSELEKTQHSALRVLSKSADKDDIRQFLIDSIKMAENGERENIDAVYAVSLPANAEIFLETFRNGGDNMFEELKPVLQPYIDKEMKKREYELKEKSRQEGADMIMLDTIRKMIKSLGKTPEEIMDLLCLTGEQKLRYITQL